MANTYCSVHMNSQPAADVIGWNLDHIDDYMHIAADDRTGL